MNKLPKFFKFEQNLLAGMTTLSLSLIMLPSQSVQAAPPTANQQLNQAAHASLTMRARLRSVQQNNTAPLQLDTSQLAVNHTLVIKGGQVTNPQLILQTLKNAKIDPAQVEHIQFAQPLSLAGSTDLLFAGLGNLTDVDLKNCNTADVTSMEGMFLQCGKLKTINNSQDLNTTSVTNMGSMFEGCNTLQQLDLSSWDTSRVTDMGEMFLDCGALTSLNLSGFKTTNVTDMGSMFDGCSSLRQLTLTNFTRAITATTQDMFNDCQELPVLIVHYQDENEKPIAPELVLSGNDGATYQAPETNEPFVKQNYVLKTPAPTGKFAKGVVAETTYTYARKQLIPPIDPNEPAQQPVIPDAPNLPDKPEIPNQPLPQVKVRRQMLHSAYIYDHNHRRINPLVLPAYAHVMVAPNITVLTDGELAYQLEKNHYIMAGNISGTQRKLKHNAYIYRTSYKRANRHVLAKGRTIITYGSPFEFKDGKLYYRIGGPKKQYVKVANF